MGILTRLALTTFCPPIAHAKLLHDCEGRGSNFQLGQAVCGAGDLDGGGVQDLTVGDYGADLRAKSTGPAHVFSG